MRILISNDDGIHAEGIRALTNAVHDLGDIVVVAPDRQRSASSHGITLHDRIYVDKVDLDIPNVTAYSVAGTPVDCVKWAVTHLGREESFDLMLSGINEGPNLATDVLYSGTLAAAGEASLQQIPSIAFSLLGTPYFYEEAAFVSRRIVTAMLPVAFPPDTFLSVNYPASNIMQARWTVTELGARSYKDEFRSATDDAGRVYYRYMGEALEEVGGEDTDVAAVERNEVSITPLRYRFTNTDMIATLRTSLHQTL